MGERGNVCVKHSDGDVYLYTHWYGDVLAETVRRALARKQRWTDGSYLTRIIFCEMLREAGPETALDSETGFGISTHEQDNNYPVIYVDPEQQMVTISGVGIPFTEFIRAKVQKPQVPS